MTQALPDLTRPTLWRLHLRLFWGNTLTHEFEGVYLEDALAAARGRNIQPAQVVEAEFRVLETNDWRQVPANALQEAIVLVMRT